MLALDNEDRLVLREGVMLHSIPRENWYYAFSVVTGDQFRLNGPSFWILETIGRGVTWRSLQESFLEEYDVDAVVGWEDLANTVAELLRETPPPLPETLFEAMLE